MIPISRNCMEFLLFVDDEADALFPLLGLDSKL